MLAIGPAALSDPERVLHEAAKVAERNNHRHSMSAGVEPAIRRPAFGMDDAAIAAMRAAEERANREREVERLLKQCGVPQLYRNATLDSSFAAVPEEVVYPLDRSQSAAAHGRVRVRELYADAANRLAVVLARPCLVALIGVRGPGKTWLGCAAVQDCCRSGRAAMYAEAMDYFDQVKETYSGRNSEDRESRVLARFAKPYLLVLDEVHERGDTPWEDRQLTRLINKRYAACLPTILIANQTEAEFEARVGLSIADRFYDGGDIIRCEWGSLRGRIATPANQ